LLGLRLKLNSACSFENHTRNKEIDGEAEFSRKNILLNYWSSGCYDKMLQKSKRKAPATIASVNDKKNFILNFNPGYNQVPC